MIVYLTLTLPAVVLYESFLSYLGTGIQPPQAGLLIAQGAAQINPVRVYWWMILFPAGARILLMVLNFDDGLRDVFDPKAANEGQAKRRQALLSLVTSLRSSFEFFAGLGTAVGEAR